MGRVERLVSTGMYVHNPLLKLIGRQVYDQALEDVLNELGLDARGVAASNGWDVDGSLLRSSIRRLRGICTHPQVGQLQRQNQNDKLFKPGALKTIEDVLQVILMRHYV